MANVVLEDKKKVKKAVVKKAIKTTVKNVVKAPAKKIVSEKAAQEEAKIVVSLEQIQQKAYELYEKRSNQTGDAMQDWLEAKKILGVIE